MVPGVESSALAIIPVLAGNEWDSSMAVEGFQHKPKETPDPHMQFVSPNYFQTMNVPCLMGRDFPIPDAPGPPPNSLPYPNIPPKFFTTPYPLRNHTPLGAH